MGQAPAGQVGQVGGGNFGAAPRQDDAFRHFRDNSGALSNNPQNQQCQQYSNQYSQQYSQQIQPYGQSNSLLNGVQDAVVNGVQGGFRKTKEACANLPLYTDVTRPNGGPMDRSSPMERDLPPRQDHGFGQNRQDHGYGSHSQDHGYGSPAKDHGYGNHSQDHGYGSSHRDNGFGATRMDSGVGSSCRMDNGYGPNRIDSGVGPSSSSRMSRMMDHELGPTRPNSNFNMNDYDRYSDCSRVTPHAPAPPPVATKAEASTMMSTAFLKRNDMHGRENHEEKRDGVVLYRINTNMEEVGEAQCGGHHQSHQKHQHQDSVYNGMVTSDEPILGVPIAQQQPPRTPSHQAPPSQDSSALLAGAKMNVQDELKLRESWSVGSVIEVYSSSASKWYIAQVVQVGAKNAPSTLTVQFIGDNGQIMQKSMPRSDMQLAPFGRNTRQMPPGFQKVASESRPGEFSYQDTSTMTKYQTKEFAWQSYYLKVLKCEQAQQLLAQQCGGAPQGQPQAMKPAPTMSLAQQAPSHAQHQKVESLSPELYAGALGPDPVLAKTWKDPNEAPQQYMQPITTSALTGGGAQSASEAYASYAASGGANKLQSRQSFVQQTKPKTVGDMSSIQQPSSALKPSAPFPGYGQSFAVGQNAGYESYLASQGLA